MTSAPQSTDSKARDRIRKGLLHPVIEKVAYSDYQSGRYEDPLTHPYKEIEIRVRGLSLAPPSAIGVNLMNDSFGPTGKLTDSSLVSGEQKGLAYLFAGAFGWVRNPNAHRRVQIDPAEAAELVFLASYLMRKLDEAEMRLNRAS
jgi:uncharacterized protein (TIGR02391 family)